MDNFDNLLEKQKIISIFMQQLENKSIFKDVISKEEIKTKLIQNVKYVKCIRKHPYIKAIWNSNYDTLYLCNGLKSLPNNLNISNRTTAYIVHELLHALTTRDSNNVGFQKRNGDIKVGLGLNEGMTQNLTERITNTSFPKTYAFEKSAYSIFSCLVDEKYFLSDYLYGTNKIEEQFSNKYGSYMLELYNAANKMLDNITISDSTKFKNDSAPEEIQEAKVLSEKSKEMLNRVIDRMVKISLKKMDNPLEVSKLLSTLDEYPGKDSFKEFDLEKEKEINNSILNNSNSQMTNIQKNIFEQTNNVTLTQINKQTKHLEQCFTKYEINSDLGLLNNDSGKFIDKEK